MDRKAELINWINRIDRVAGCDLTPASRDASFRRYFRLHAGAESFIVMDAPPPLEDCLPFVSIAGYLEAMQLNAPRVIEADIERGFLLLTDLGATQYLEKIAADESAISVLYDDAIDALAKMQTRGVAYQAMLPPYDADLLNFELSLFHDWLCGTHVGISFSGDEELQWRELCALLTANALDQPQVFVHRDYHSRNLMVTDSDNPGILDFQDAVEGPLTYDLVSLLKDCYLRLPPKTVHERAKKFYTAQSDEMRARVGEQQFMRFFELMGVQRHLKAAGIFCRLNHRDGKSGYLKDIPRTLSYIVEVAPQHSELEFVSGLIAQRCLPAFGEGS